MVTRLKSTLRTLTFTSGCSMLSITKIISGGQTGADRAALDFALEAGIPYGGWVPKGRRSETGTISVISYPLLVETPSADYTQRTRRNVEESDGTVIYFMRNFGRGSNFTWKCAAKANKPRSFADLEKVDVNEAAEQLKEFIMRSNIRVLNIAGSRASKAPLIYDKVLEVLRKAHA